MASKTYQVTLPSGAVATVADPLQLTVREQLDYFTDLNADIFAKKDIEQLVTLSVMQSRQLVYRHVVRGIILDDGEALPAPTVEYDTTLKLTNADQRALWAKVSETIDYINPDFEPQVVDDSPKAEGTEASETPDSGSASTPDDTTTVAAAQ